MTALMEEYTYRYGKHHATERLLEPLRNRFYGDMTPFTDPPQCMPDDCKMKDTVNAYKKYYKNEKKEIAVWNKARSCPEWW